MSLLEWIESLSIFKRHQRLGATLKMGYLESNEGEVRLTAYVDIDTTQLSNEEIERLSELGWYWVDGHLVMGYVMPDITIRDDIAYDRDASL